MQAKIVVKQSTRRVKVPLCRGLSIHPEVSMSSDPSSEAGVAVGVSDDCVAVLFRVAVAPDEVIF